MILCCFMLITATVVCPNVSETAIIKASASEYTDKSGDLTVASPTKEQIKTMWENVTLYETKYDVQPSVTAPYSIGALNADYLQHGEDHLNLIRYMAGLPAIQLSDELNESAQYGAVLLAASEFSHYPSQPSDMDNDFYNKGVSATSSSNIASGYRDISSAISGFMSDEDPSNIAAVGHRRWLLNPKLYFVGLGDANYNYATKVFDQSGRDVDYNFISWPPSGNCPDSFFNYYDPWSITLNPSKYSKIENIKITLTRTSDGKVWIFDSNTSNDPYTKGDYLNTNLSGYGVSNCIVFRPAFEDIYVYNGVYTVEVSGLYDKNEAPVTLKYQTDFFNFFDSYKILGYPTEIGGECTVGCEDCDYTQTFKTYTELKLLWDVETDEGNFEGIPTTFNVGDKLNMDNISYFGPACKTIIHISDETAITSTYKGEDSYTLTFKKEGIYSFTVYFKYSPHIFKTYTVYVGNTEGFDIPEPFIPHGETIIYPAEKGGECNVSCAECNFENIFSTSIKLELYWNPANGYLQSSFDNVFNVGDNLYMRDLNYSGVENEKIICVSDETAITYMDGGYGDYTFIFEKEGIYTFTVYYKYAPHIYKTYTVYVGNTEGYSIPEAYVPHAKIIGGYPTTIGGANTVKCSQCNYAQTFVTKTELDILWSLTNDGVWYTGFDNIFNVGDKLYVYEGSFSGYENEKLFHIPDENAISYTDKCNGDHILTFEKEGIYTFTVSYKYAPHIYKAYTVYVGNTEGCTVPEPYIPHNETIEYPAERGEDCTIACTDCEFSNTFTPDTYMSLWWNRDNKGTYWSSFNSEFNIGDKLYLWDKDASGIESERIIELSDESGVKLKSSSIGHYTFTFAKEGIYSFTIYCKYYPEVYRTYTVVVKDPNKTYNIGDVNEDGNIDKSDYLLIKRYCFDTASLSGSQMITADINDDGYITKEDYILLKRHCFGTYSIG